SGRQGAGGRSAPIRPRGRRAADPATDWRSAQAVARTGAADRDDGQGEAPALDPAAQPAELRAMACPICDDTGWKPVEDGGVRRVVRCDCWRDRAAADALAHANIPARYQTCEFSNFTTYPNEQLLNAVAAAQRFAERFPVVDKGLLIIGPPGIG